MWSAVLLWAEQDQQTPSNPLTSFLPILLMLVVGYFLLFRPMQKQEKQRQALVLSLKKNDKVVTSGGIIGVVDAIKEKEDEVVLKGGLHITKSSIVRVVKPEEAAKEP
jgi:preprotein translocase YajC subunit